MELKNETDFAISQIRQVIRRQLRKRSSIKEDFARGRLVQCTQQVKQRGLADAGLPGNDGRLVLEHAAQRLESVAGRGARQADRQAERSVEARDIVGSGLAHTAGRAGAVDLVDDQRRAERAALGGDQVERHGNRAAVDLAALEGAEQGGRAADGHHLDVIVGQIAKLKGCSVRGSVGSDAKIDFIKDELGFDAGFNYKSTDNYYIKLQELSPRGIDIYFDNVGGPISDAVFGHINTRARIAICGQISQYNAQKLEQGPRLLWKLIEKQAKVEGFLVFQYVGQFREAMQQLSAWVDSGQLKYRERIVDGLENAPRAFLEMLQGENIGKQLVKISDPPVGNRG